MITIERTAYPRFKQILSAKGLTEIYTSTPVERLAAYRTTKGRAAEVGFLVFLKTYQRLDRFVSLREVPSSIIEVGYRSRCSAPAHSSPSYRRA